MTDQTRTPAGFEDLPQARTERNWKTWLFWLVPVAAAGLAGYFIYSDLVSRGPTIQIYFDNAAGLEPGQSTVKYRGAEVGSVKEVKLTRDHREVAVTVALDASAESLAREGSRFWIVKPQIGAEQISGLRTIVSGDYITVEPGGGKPQKKFTGLAEEPIVESSSVYTVVLLSETAGSLKKRSPVFYRGVQVGQVIGFGLGKESQTVKTKIEIEQRFVPLIRLNSKFWNAGGINVNIGLSGADISAQSAQALLSGGIAFATPAPPDKPAPAGTSFRLYDKPEDAWLAWAPAIPLSGESSEGDDSAKGGSQ